METKSEYVSADAPKKRPRCTRKVYAIIAIGSLEDQLEKAKQGQEERLRLINQSQE